MSADILWRGEIMAVYPDDQKSLTELFKQRALHPDTSEFLSWYEWTGELQDGTVKNEKLMLTIRRAESGKDPRP